jgi:hypothetical protein
MPSFHHLLRSDPCFSPRGPPFMAWRDYRHQQNRGRPDSSTDSADSGTSSCTEAGTGSQSYNCYFRKGVPGMGGRMRNAKARQNSTPHSAPNSVMSSLGWTFEFDAESFRFTRIITNRDEVHADLLANSAWVMPPVTHLRKCRNISIWLPNTEQRERSRRSQIFVVYSPFMLAHSARGVCAVV